MAPKRKCAHASKKAHYAGYKVSNRAEKNRKAGLAKHLKKHPGDKQAAVAANRTDKPHRAKPKGNKAKVREEGLTRGADNLWRYVPSHSFLPGHPVLKMLKEANFSHALKYTAIWKT
jgi:hypothetical protein